MYINIERKILKTYHTTKPLQELFIKSVLLHPIETAYLKNDALLFPFSYLKLRSQNVRLSNTESFFRMLITEVSQRSFLQGSILRNIFKNDFSYYRQIS